jgi:hypothetical protein
LESTYFLKNQKKNSKLIAYLKSIISKKLKSKKFKNPTNSSFENFITLSNHHFTISAPHNSKEVFTFPTL